MNLQPSFDVVLTISHLAFLDQSFVSIMICSFFKINFDSRKS